MPEISVIVPVYNAERYLSRCVDSILSQTFTDFELLLVDDGSRDASGSMCDDYALKNSRVRVFHKENGGVSSARNMGLENAKGEWIAFVDADDWTKSSYLDNLLVCINDNVDLVISGCTTFNACNEESQLLLDENNFSCLFFENKICFTTPWGKLYRRRRIEDMQLRFLEDMKLGEDVVFLYSYISFPNIGICLSRDAGYYYEMEIEGSLSKHIFSLQEEHTGYKHVILAIDNLIYKKKIDSPKAIAELELLKAYLCRRVLNALYCNKVRRKERLMVFKSINMSLYAIKLTSDYWREGINRWLLLRQHYVLYDAMRKFISWIK